MHKGNYKSKSQSSMRKFKAV